MQRVIYYPSFEVFDENWLKFALLYLDQLRPIVPKAGERYFSDRFRRIIESTDLISPYRPSGGIAADATIHAVETCDRILRRPSAYKDIFKYDNVVDVWRHRDSQRYTIFEDKYTDTWEHFVINNKIGHHVKEGVAVSKSLGLVFMTLLAQAVSSKVQIPPMTDLPELDRFSILTAQTSPADQAGFQVAQGIINVTLPANIDSIEVTDVVNFRNRPGFKVRLHAFHLRLQDFLNSVEEGSVQNNINHFTREQDSLFTDFSDEIASIGFGSISAALGVWLFIGSANGNPIQYVKDLAAAGVLATTSIVTIRNAITKTRSKRFTRKYLADLRKLDMAI